MVFPTHSSVKLNSKIVLTFKYKFMMLHKYVAVSKIPKEE